MDFTTLKNLMFAEEARATPVLRGPFRGANFHAVPKASMRKILGLYEHELNDWIQQVLPRVQTVLDVGANDGYFTFGCAAAFRRLRQNGRIVAFDPDPISCQQLRTAAQRYVAENIEVTIEQTFVGKETGDNCTTLAALASNFSRRKTLIKIDVEGAELDVLEGASGWMDPSNYFLIEVHHEEYLDVIMKRFAAHNLMLELRTQQPLPLLGRESRAESNCWLVSALS